VTELIPKNILIHHEGKTPFYDPHDLPDHIEIHPHQCLNQKNRSRLLEYVDIFVDSILTHIESDKRIAICDLAESFEMEFMLFCDKVFKKLIASKKFNIEQLMIITGCVPVEQNFYHYINHCSKNNLLRYSILFINWFEYRMAREAVSKLDDIKNHPTTDTKRNIFLFLNKEPRVHRIYTLSNLIRRNLIEKVSYSFGSIEKFNCPRDLSHKMKDHVELVHQLELPKYLSIDFDDILKQHTISDKDLALFSETHLSIISETLFFKSAIIDLKNNHNHLDSFFLTEKTYRAIACRHPFILMSRPRTLRVLKMLGYKTFSPWIDESYDEIEDDFERLNKILDIIEDLSQKNTDFWIDFMKMTAPLVDHNFKILTSYNFAYPHVICRSAFYPFDYPSKML
jgi:hypothetical protein